MDKVIFKGLNKSKSTAKPVVTSLHGREVVEVVIDRVVLVYLKQEGISYESIKSVKDVVDLEKEHNLLIETRPPLYERFLDKNKNIRTFVKIGDTVEPNELKSNRAKGPGFVLSSFSLHGVVTNLRFGKLCDKAIIVADVNNESVLSYYLRKVKEDGQNAEI